MCHFAVTHGEQFDDQFTVSNVKEGARGRPPCRDGHCCRGYCNSFSTSCCTLLACARAEMPVWLRIWYFDMFEAAVA
jgi:hypothetical protein